VTPPWDKLTTGRHNGQLVYITSVAEKISIPCKTMRTEICNDASVPKANRLSSSQTGEQAMRQLDHCPGSKSEYEQSASGEEENEKVFLVV
jgi:hypothetical protein